MRIICLVKFVPDVDNFRYDYERHVLIRDKAQQVLNSDDAAAIAWALRCKQERADVTVEIVTMGPESVLDCVRDLLRRGADRATILSDKWFAGSDTYATSLILAAYLKESDFDLILSGTRSLDGDTAHVPAQVAQLLGLEHMSAIKSLDQARLPEQISFTVETEWELLTYEMMLPALCSLTRDAPYKLPHVRYHDLDLYVDDRIRVLSNSQLNLPEEALGLRGSLTRIVHTYTREPQPKEQVVVQADEAGIERVYQFLIEKGYL